MKKKPIVFTLIAIVALALACAAVFLYERSKVALIIDDDLVAGYRDGWFAIEMNGNIGYIREEYVSWDAIDIKE